MLGYASRYVITTENSNFLLYIFQNDEDANIALNKMSGNSMTF